MSYVTKINDRVKIVNLKKALNALYYLGFNVRKKAVGPIPKYYDITDEHLDEPYYTELYTNAGRNLTLSPKNNPDAVYKIRNTLSGNNEYNVYDIIAAAKANGTSDKDIADALNKAGVSSNNYDENGIRDFGWTPEGVADLNHNTTKQSERIYNFLKDKGYANTKVVTLLNNNGRGYTYAIEYTDANGIPQQAPLTDLNDDFTDAELSKILESEDIAPYAKAPGGVITGSGITAQQAADYRVLADELSKFADQMGITTVKSDYNITPEQYAELKVKLPNYSDQQLLNAIEQSGWTTDLLKGPDFKSDTKEYRSLDDRENIAQEATDIAQDQANILTQSKAQTALNEDRKSVV